MLRKITIALAAASLLGAAAIPTHALAFGRGGGGGGGMHMGGGGGGMHMGGGGGGMRFGGGGFGGRGFGPGFRHRGFGLGYGGCYAWTPYGYRWICGYPYY